MKTKTKAKKDSAGNAFISVSQSVLHGENKSNASVRPLKAAETSLEEATANTKQAQELFSTAIYNCYRSSAELARSLKKSTSIVRQSFDGVNSQLSKLQKTLSKDDAKSYADDLERIATALDKITELNDSGKLKGIFKAL